MHRYLCSNLTYIYKQLYELFADDCSIRNGMYHIPV